MEERTYLLEIKELSVSYGEKKALDAVSFVVFPGITVGILGEKRRSFSDPWRCPIRNRYWIPIRLSYPAVCVREYP